MMTFDERGAGEMAGQEEDMILWMSKNCLLIIDHLTDTFTFATKVTVK